MSTFEIILFFIGVILLVLAVFSGVKLFQKASKENADENTGGMGTLWLLFLLGITGGLLFIWLSMNNIDSSYVSWSIIGIFIISGIFALMSFLG